MIRRLQVRIKDPSLLLLIRRFLKAGYVDANSKLRDELLNRELSLHIDGLRYVADRWRMDYNYYRPHSSVDSTAPAVFAADVS